MPRRRPARFPLLPLLAAAALVNAGGAALADPPPFGLDLERIEQHAARAREARKNIESANRSDESLGLLQAVTYQPDLPLAAASLIQVPGTDVAFGVGYLAAITIDTALGTRIRTQRVADPDGWPPYSSTYLIAEHDGVRRLMISTRGGTRLYDLSNPREMVPIGIGPAAGGLLALMPNQRQAINAGDWVAIFNVDDGSLVEFFDERWIGAFSGGPADAPIVVGVMQPSRNDPTSLHVLRWVGGTRLEELLLTPLEPGLEIQQLDSRGELLLGSRYDLAANRQSVEALQATTGAALWSLEVDSSSRFGLVETAGARRLWVTRADAMDLYDLDQPGTPHLIQSVSIQGLFDSNYGRLDPLVLALKNQPVLVAIDRVQRELVTIDAGHGAVIARTTIPTVNPRLAAVDDTDPGHARAFVLGDKRTNTSVASDGGLELLDTYSLDDPAHPTLISRFDEVTPARFQRVEPLLGRYSAFADFDSNVLGVYDFSQQKLVHATGFSGYAYDGYSTRLTVSGSFAAVSYGAHLELFQFDGERLQRMRVIDETHAEYGWHDLALRADGTMVTLGEHALYIYTPSGARKKLPLTLQGERLRWSPDQKLLLVDPEYWYITQENIGASMIDFADPENPYLLWSGPTGAYGQSIVAHFVRGGEAVAMTGVASPWYALQPQLFDARSGVPLGAPGGSVFAYFYFDPVLSLGQGDSARTVYWHWTFFGWRTTIFDVSQDSPKLVSESAEYFDPPAFASHTDPQRFYELREDWLNGGQVLVGGSDGTYEEYGRAPTIELLPLRRGFLIGRTPPLFGNDQQLILMRDPAVNLPPVAVISGVRSLECESPEGTQLALDSSSSTDPDSAPGTQDDIESREWTLDRSPAGSEVALNASLGLGAHAVTLAITDLLAARGEVEAAILVSDTQAPEVQLELAPVIDGTQFEQRWEINSSAIDRCEGPLAPQITMTLGTDVLDAPVTVRIAAETGIDIRRSSRGALTVTLLGPDDLSARAWWESIRVRGGLPVLERSTPQLLTPVRPPVGASDLAARYRLLAGFLVGAVEYGVNADFHFVASAADSAGNRDSRRSSLREARERICAALPAGVSCAGVQ